MQQINYTVINHVAREKLGLTWLEYGLADLIYHLSNNPDAEVDGWCYASKDHLSKTLLVSRRHIHRMLNTLIEKKLLEKSADTKFLKTTALWYNTVIASGSDKMSQGVTKSHTDSDKMSHIGSDKMSHHNNIYNNNNNNILDLNKSNPLKKEKQYSEKQLQYQRICTHLEEKLHTKITNFVKQTKALQMAFKAGYTEKQIIWVINQMAMDDFYADKGFDLMTVMNQLPIYKAKARKGVTANVLRKTE